MIAHELTRDTLGEACVVVAGELSQIPVSASQSGSSVASMGSSEAAP